MSRRSEFKAVKAEMRGPSRFRGTTLLLTILAFIAAVAVWANFTEIDDVNRADGTVVPSSKTQIIQAAEPGILDVIHVRKGDLVAAGDVLMEFDGTLLESQFKEETQRAAALQARILRLTAEMNNVAPEFTEDLIRKVPDVVASEQNLYQARLSELDAERQVLEAQRVQRQQEKIGSETERDTAQRALDLVEEEIALMEPLVERRVEPETTMLALRRSKNEVVGQVTRAEANIRGVELSLAEVDLRIEAMESAFRTRSISDLTLAASELSEVRTRLPALQARAARSELRSPVDGVVNQVLLTTRGGFAQAGQALLEIVPIDDTLLVEAYIRPTDIAFLHPGQGVKIKISAYDFARYGSLDGQIVGIGANAVTHPNGEEQVFVVEVRAERALLDSQGEELQIIPGMTAQVDILSGRKTILDYIIRPVIKVQETAFRD